MLIASWSKDSESRDEQFAEARISWWKLCLGESLSRWASLSDRWTWPKNTGWVFSDQELCEGSVIPGSPLARCYLLSSSVYSACPFQSPWAYLGGSPGTAFLQSFFLRCLTQLPTAASILSLPICPGIAELSSGFPESRCWDKNLGRSLYGR